ncbi:MAG: trypsin-like serine protease, partial [Burkholderiales bacterium]
DEASCTMHFLDFVTNQSDFMCKTWVYQASSPSTVLMKTGVTIQTYEQCDSRYKAVLEKLKIPYGADPLFSETVSPQVFCTWDAQDDSTPCYGDSGGPVVKSVGGVERVFAIVGSGLLPNCILTDQIGIFPRVTYFASFIAYTMDRSLALGHTNLCPGGLAPVISYAARQDGKQDVRLSWPKDNLAEGYRVFYAPHASMGANAQKLEVPAGQTDVSVVLAPGQKFFVTVQARSARCDGPLSALMLVKVP